MEPLQTLRSLRKFTGLTQEQLAKKLAADVDTVGRWERGKSKPMRAFQAPYAEALGITVAKLEDILNGKGGE